MATAPAGLVIPGDLYSFASPGDLLPRLRALTSLAAAENWEFRLQPADANRPLPLLQSYIRYTFRRLAEERKVAVLDRLACFNTGLATPHQEEIYALLVPNSTPGRQPWLVEGFYAESDWHLTDFHDLPERAQYFDNPADLLYDSRLPLRRNLTHIIEENQARFPEPFRSDSDTHRLRVTLEGAIGHAVRRVRQNYKTAVPQFFWPGGDQGQLQLLLPLAMTAATEVDVALTVSRHDGFYRASTVLTLDMAYNNARLVARPDSDWLTP